MLAGALCAAAAPAAASVSARETTRPLAYGIDVSSYQHLQRAGINWDRVARSGIRFVGIKVTEGNYYVNPYYASDSRGALRAGLYVAPYVFANPHASGGAAQARYAVARVGDRDASRSLPLQVDLETDPYTRQEHVNVCYGLSKARMVAWIEAFAAAARGLTHRSPLIYTDAAWWRRCVGNTTVLRGDPLWIADYGVRHPEMPAGWRGWTFWQYRRGAPVRGVAYHGGADLSYASPLFTALTR